MTEETSLSQIKPLADRVLAQRLKQEEVAKGGVIVPESARKKQEKAKVIAIGVGKKNKDGSLIPIPVEVGDLILIDKYAGQEINIGDEEYVMVRADDIVAKIK